MTLLSSHPVFAVDELIRTIGEDAFSEGYSICDISENTAYTYTNTTVQNVAAGEKYALFMNDGGIYEYTSDQSSHMINIVFSTKVV